MAQWNGKFKLTAASNCPEFYKSVGRSQKEIDENAVLDNPANDFVAVQKVENGEIHMEFLVAGEKKHEEKYKIGEEVDLAMGEIKYKLKTTIDGNKWIDTRTRGDNKKTTYERTLDGDKITLVMSSDAGVKATKEFMRQ